jgi:Xaa-Pro dipeptidase
MRLQAALAQLQRDGKNGLVALSNGHNSFLESNAIFVLAGFRAIGESALVVDTEGSATLIVTPAWDAQRAREQSPIANVVGAQDLAPAALEAMAASGLSAKNCVVVGLSTARRDLTAEMERGAGGAMTALDDLARELAKIRTAEELEHARKAAWIAERGYERMLASAKPGMREFELAADLYCEMKALGAEDNFLLMSASQHNLAVRAAGQRILEEGDIILAEITPCFRGQFVQICRTAVIGRPRPAVSEKFAILQGAMRRGQDAALPGTRVSDVTRAINEHIEAAGYGTYCRPPYMRVRGHGLGITSSCPGDIESENHLELESGMVFVMHPNQYIPESGYLLCGETVVIGPRGAESLSSRDAQLDVIPV